MPTDREYRINLPLRPGESDVCQRLAALRRFSGRSQEGLAKSIGVTRIQLANAELGRTALKFWMGWKSCLELNVNQAYLAFGRLPQRPFQDFDPLAAASFPIRDDDSFLSVCSGALSGELKFRADLIQEGETGQLTGDGLIRFERVLAGLIGIYIESSPEAERVRVVERLVDACRKAHAEVAKRRLTELYESANYGGVKTQMAGLLARLRKATRERGSKSLLAEFLGVPLANVSQWLSGQREPGGEYALKMLRWVEKREKRQQ